MRSLFAALWQVEFALRLSRAASTRISRKTLRRAISRLPDGRMPGTDRARAFNLTLAQSLHAAVHLLERELGFSRAEAVSVARRAFVDTGSWMARAGVRLWLWAERDPFAGVKTRGAASFAQALWGDGMVVQDRHSDDAVSLCVLNCPFHDYFWNVSCTNLTPILCAWDTAWQTEVNASDKPIRVDISSTLSEGAAMCEFTFRKPAGTRS
ncbi:MAG: L-2-amino-thiazoline-4-carboxylic acid hydrolase [Pseudomonadota bacterium]